MSSERPPKVLLLTPMFHGHDGISLVSRTAAAAIAQQGYEVNVYSLADEPLVEMPAGIRLWSAQGRVSKFVAKAASAALRSSANDVVLAMHLHFAITALPLVWRGARLSIFLHGVEAWKPLRLRERIGIRAASSVLANSATTVQGFREANRQFRDLPIEVCPLGISPLSDTVQGPGLRSGRFALIVGRLDSEFRYKGHDELLELWPAVVDQFPGFCLVIAGDGHDRQRLQEKAISLGLSECVHFTGQVSNEELQRLYRDCEFFAMPSTGEGFGLVYLEAMRAGKACLGAPGAAADLIENGRTGVIADPSRKDELLRALLSLIGQPQQAAQMGVAGQRRFLNCYTADRFNSALLSALKLKDPEVAKCAG